MCVYGEALRFGSMWFDVFWAHRPRSEGHRYSPSRYVAKPPPKYSLNTDIFSEVKDSYVDTVRSTIYRMDSEDVSWVDYEVSLKLDQTFCTYEEFLGRRIMDMAGEAVNEATF